ncbi:MAG: hypothetical protein ACLQIQ_08965 [Beijerinckiaceae bacterium]
MNYEADAPALPRRATTGNGDSARAAITLLGGCVLEDGRNEDIRLADISCQSLEMRSKAIGQGFIGLLDTPMSLPHEPHAKKIVGHAFLAARST